MKISVRSQRFFGKSCFALLLFATSATPAQAQSKVPREVIDSASTHGSVLVLVGLKVPWQMESKLDVDELLSQRAAIASIQSDLLNTLKGRSYKVVRRYQEVPGIALEVGADALAELARLPIVTNVLLDRPTGSSVDASPVHHARRIARGRMPNPPQRKKCHPRCSSARQATAPFSCSPGCEHRGSAKIS